MKRVLSDTATKFGTFRVRVSFVVSSVRDLDAWFANWLSAANPWKRNWQSGGSETEEVLVWSDAYLGVPSIASQTLDGFELELQGRAGSEFWKDWLVRVIDDFCRDHPGSQVRRVGAVPEVAVNIAEMRDVLEFLYKHKAPALRFEDLAEVLDQLIWCLDDNGEALLRVRESWLTSDDRGRVELALAMRETFPFRDAAQMVEVLTQISGRWPDLRDTCEKLIQARSAAESAYR